MGLSETSAGGTSPVRSSGSPRAILSTRAGRARSKREYGQSKALLLSSLLSCSQTQASAAQGARREGRINAPRVRCGSAGMPRCSGAEGGRAPPRAARSGERVGVGVKEPLSLSLVFERGDWGGRKRGGARGAMVIARTRSWVWRGRGANKESCVCGDATEGSASRLLLPASASAGGVRAGPSLARSSLAPSPHQQSIHTRARRLRVHKIGSKVSGGSLECKRKNGMGRQAERRGWGAGEKARAPRAARPLFLFTPAPPRRRQT